MKFPPATEDEREGGWTLSYRFLEAIQTAARLHDPDVSLEQTEAVLLAAQAHALLLTGVPFNGHTD
jgi:hypothetical protein